MMSLPQPKIVFSDFDGTLTDGDEFSEVFFQLKNLLIQHKIPLVIVTGRPKSWAHFLLSHFEFLDYVITENGGTITHFKDNILKDELLVDEMEVRRLEALTQKLMNHLPHLELSGDSSGRLADRAIELDWLNQHPQEAKEIVSFFKKENISYSQSSIHMNFWCGNLSKANAIKTFIKEYAPQINSKATIDEVLYFGDSLNDESAFEALPHSVGVSNIDQVIERIKHKPRVILEGQEKRGIHGVYSTLSNLLK